VVVRRELLRAGITPEEIRQRLRRGTLLREYPGVYRVGHRALSLEARYLAAVLACGEASLLGGRAAAYLWGLLKRTATAPPPEVIAPTKRRVKGLATHRSRRIDPDDATAWRGIPVTTPARTIVDLASLIAVDDLARARMP
jgi:hypothetical protein